MEPLGKVFKPWAPLPGYDDDKGRHRFLGLRSLLQFRAELHGGLEETDVWTEFLVSIVSGANT